MLPASIADGTGHTAASLDQWPDRTSWSSDRARGQSAARLCAVWPATGFATVSAPPAGQAALGIARTAEQVRDAAGPVGPHAATCTMSTQPRARCHQPQWGLQRGPQVRVVHVPAQVLEGWLMHHGTTRRIIGIPIGSLGTALVALLLTASTAMGSVTWTSPTGAARSATFNFGSGLARTVSGSTPYLHIQVGSDVIGGVAADDDGPYAGVFYRRGNASGTSWGALTRVSPSDVHAYQGSIAASGSHVYVAWMTIAHYTAYNPAEPRTIGFRANANHGASSAWGAPVALTTSGRANNVNVAAAGSHVYVSYTDSDTGQIMVQASPDDGATWSPVAVATTTATNGDAGFAGWPEIAATGSTVAVTWIDQNSGDGMFSMSTDYGATFSVPAKVAVNPVSALAIAAKGDRIALAVVDESGTSVRVWKAGKWGRSRPVLGHDPSGNTTYKAAYGPAVVLSGTSTVAVAVSACRRTSACTAGSKYGVDVLWKEFKDDGRTPKRLVTVASYSASKSKRYNEFPSILMPSAKKRIITYTSASATWSTYRVYVEVGKGAS
jgi:hypothetical protein